MAYTLDHALNKMGRLSYVLDGDNIRHGLCNDLNFCTTDRGENNRRVGACFLMAAVTSYLPPQCASARLYLVATINELPVCIVLTLEESCEPSSCWCKGARVAECGGNETFMCTLKV